MERGRPSVAAAGSGRRRAPPPGGAALPPRLSTAWFAVPAAWELEEGPALGVHLGWRKAFPSGQGLGPGALAVAPDRLSLFIANVISHADFALALSVELCSSSCKDLCPKTFFSTRWFYRGVCSGGLSGRILHTKANQTRVCKVGLSTWVL